MQRELLSPATQRLALLSASTPAPEMVFLHQAKVLMRAGFCTQEALDVAAGFLPAGPFLFIPGIRLPVVIMLSAIAAAYRTGLASRVDLKHLVTDLVETFDGPYFITGYDEVAESSQISADECEEACRADARSPLTMLELAYRLLYFPHALGETQFAAAGSCIERGEKEMHVPVFSLPGGTESDTLILGSFLRGHHSRVTLFPSCGKRIPVSRPRY